MSLKSFGDSCTNSPTKSFLLDFSFSFNCGELVMCYNVTFKTDIIMVAAYFGFCNCDSVEV